MADCLRSKKVKIRKDRNCFGCFKKLDKGTENILSETCVQDEDIYTIYFCKECQDWLKECDKCKECYEMETADIGYIKDCMEGNRR